MFESNICIFANRYKTVFYDAVLKRMNFPAEQVFWIVNGRRWRRFLLDAGYPDENILYYDVTDIDTPADTEFLRSLEEHADHTVRQMILSDRRLFRRTPDSEGALSRFGRLVYTFLQKHDIPLVLGECTWSVELITSAACRALGILYVSPHTIRIPSERFAFFTDPFQRSFLEVIAIDNQTDDQERIQRMLAEQEIPRPNYWFLNNQVPSVKAGYFAKLLSHARSEWFDNGRSEYMEQTLIERIRNRARMIRNAGAIRRLPFVSDIRSISDTHRLVLLTLHKQPEASIDVMGGIHTDQAALIQAVSRLLPSDYRLLVKEHSNALGDRGREFYDALIALGNVVLVDPWADSRTLLKQVDAAITVSGTIAMEASILGTRAIALCNAFFTGMPNVHHVTDLTDIPAILDCPLESRTDALDRFFDNMLRYSHPGLIGDPYCVPASMSDSNLDLVARAFGELFATVEIHQQVRSYA